MGEKKKIRYLIFSVVVCVLILGALLTLGGFISRMNKQVEELLPRLDKIEDGLAVLEDIFFVDLLGGTIESSKGNKKFLKELEAKWSKLTPKKQWLNFKEYRHRTLNDIERNILLTKLQKERKIWLAQVGNKLI